MVDVAAQASGDRPVAPSASPARACGAIPVSTADPEEVTSCNQTQIKSITL
jgi:hypothetical protein